MNADNALNQSAFISVYPRLILPCFIQLSKSDDPTIIALELGFYCHKNK